MTYTNTAYAKNYCQKHWDMAASPLERAGERPLIGCLILQQVP